MAQRDFNSSDPLVFSKLSKPKFLSYSKALNNAMTAPQAIEIEEVIGAMLVDNRGVDDVWSSQKPRGFFIMI
jgi:hypothetical protein